MHDSKRDTADDLCIDILISEISDVVHCCTLSLCQLSQNPNDRDRVQQCTTRESDSGLFQTHVLFFVPITNYVNKYYKSLEV